MATIAVSLVALGSGSALAGSGGVSAGGDGDCKRQARLDGGRAIAPDCAPDRVKRAIRFANEIRRKPYCWGGGHGDFKDNCYDCSGAVSYALHGARLLDSPLASGALMSWGERGKGKWITVYAHSGHAYAVIAGLRWDTSMVPGDGPGWSRQMRSSDGFKVRHRGRL